MFLRLNFESVCNFVSFFIFFFEGGDPVDRMWYVEYQIFYAIHMSIHYIHMCCAKITAFDRNNLIFHCGDWFCNFIDTCTCVCMFRNMFTNIHVHTTLPIPKLEIKPKSISNVWNRHSNKFQTLFFAFKVYLWLLIRFFWIFFLLLSFSKG